MAVHARERANQMKTRHPGVPTATPGEDASTETSLLQGILKTFQDDFGGLPFGNVDQALDIITMKLPATVARDTNFRYAVLNSDPENTKVEFDVVFDKKAVQAIRQDIRFLKEFSDNPKLREWMTRSVYLLARQVVERASPPR